MTRIKVRITIKAPLEVILREIADYTHAPLLHKSRIKAVEVMEQDGYISVARWRLIVLGFLSTIRQKQTVILPNRMINETIDGFASGTIENTVLSRTSNGTEVLDIVDVNVPKLGKPIEKLIALYTKWLVKIILLDHKQDLESRFAGSQNNNPK